MLEYIYQITGLLLITFSLQSFLDKQNKKRLGTGLFWLIYGLSFCLGSFIPDWLTGLMILVLTLIAATGLFGIGTYQESDSGFKVKQALIFKNKLFIPALIVPVGTILWSQLTDISALVGLGLSSVLSLTIAISITKCSPMQSIHEGRRLLDTIGWAAILAQFLAALGYLFSQAGVGDTVSQLVQFFIPENNLLIYVMAYTFGMALFTIIMGNAFAAFAVITTGIGIPLLVVAEGGDPAIIGVIGMLSGYCGTLMTPMAANYNIVPAVLLELTNKNQIISTQFLPGLAMLVINTGLMYTLAF
jgi:uncharacterized membrane protein